MQQLPLQGIHQLFQYLERLRDDGWADLPLSDGAASPPDFAFALLAPAADANGAGLLRVRFEMEAPLGEVARIMRPEVIFHPCRAEFDGRIAACAIEELLTPGDAHAWVKAVMSRASADATASTTSGDHEDGDRRHKYQRFRITHRRDCPRIGTFALAMAPRHPKTGQLVESSALSWVRASAMMLEESTEDPGRTMVTQVTQLADGPDEDQQLTASRVFLRELTRTVQLFRTEPVMEAIVGPASYIIVSLRKCAKGNPLLPVWHCRADEAEPMLDWVAAEGCNGMKVSLPEYLLQFLARIDVTTVGVFGALDGLQLMPYQAAVQEEAWAQAWAALEEPFRMQRTAYRRIYGGSGAPVLTIGSEPRFMRPSEAQIWLTEPKTLPLATPEPKPMRVPVAGTARGFDAASGSPLSISVRVDEAFMEALAC